MTTIVTDGKSMAGDGYITSGGVMVTEDCEKVFKLPDGRILGLAGNTYNWDEVHKFFRGELNEWPKVEDDFAALILDTEGRAFIYDNKGRPWQRPVPTAIGSGRNFAIGALDAGADIRAALYASMKRDIYSGGKVTQVYLDV